MWPVYAVTMKWRPQGNLTPPRGSVKNLQEVMTFGRIQGWICWIVTNAFFARLVVACHCVAKKTCLDRKVKCRWTDYILSGCWKLSGSTTGNEKKKKKCTSCFLHKKQKRIFVMLHLQFLPHDKKQGNSPKTKLKCSYSHIIKTDNAVWKSCSQDCFNTQQYAHVDSLTHMKGSLASAYYELTIVTTKPMNGNL